MTPALINWLKLHIPTSFQCLQRQIFAPAAYRVFERRWTQPTSVSLHRANTGSCSKHRTWYQCVSGCVGAVDNHTVDLRHINNHWSFGDEKNLVFRNESPPQCSVTSALQLQDSQYLSGVSGSSICRITSAVVGREEGQGLHSCMRCKSNAKLKLYKKYQIMIRTMSIDNKV